MEGSKNTAEVRIYVACLAAYNNGILHGRWIDAEQDAWEIYDEVQDMLKASPIGEAEEWAMGVRRPIGRVSAARRHAPLQMRFGW